MMLRGNRFYLRRHVPTDLQPIIGRAEVWRSLKTDSLQIALRRFPLVTAALESEFERIRYDAGLGNGIRYGATVVYNTFPLPKLTEQNKADLTRCAENILLAREAHFPATIADLYNPETMPDDLRRAHEENDETLERIYIGRRFRNDTERLEKLFELYTKMTGKKAA